MTAPTIAPPEAQPDSFAFTEANAEKAKRVIAKYPPGRQQSAVIPLLDLAQRQHDNWLPQAAVRHVAELLDMPYIRAWEVATFYTMFNLAPVGRHLVQVCTTTPCWLRGSDAIVAACEKRLGIHLGQTSADGAFTLKEVECLGACVNAPMLQIGDGYYEDLTPENVVELLDAVAAGKAPPAGSLAGRQTSCPAGGQTSLVASDVNYGEPARRGDAAE
ncbi:NADH-quinone oxidoreductase subunit NuoE [Marinibaculum pumilum]|uniref:NADH-quinone oxidoreductase subunit NuoE n=1 Tax=Marinibaculum pumilum TaxID=1766165 RepID=A0ABV7KUF5_9PROT